jgi:hypothetical protein
MSEPDGVTAPSWNRKIGALVEHEPNCGLRDNQRDNKHVSHKADGPENRFELFLLDDGQSKVEYKEETRKPPRNPPPCACTDPTTQQASLTRPSSPSTRKTTRSATCCRSVSSNTTTSSSRHTRFRIRSLRPSSSASRPTAPSHPRMPSSSAAGTLSRTSSC